jgi:hypothetical protein
VADRRENLGKQYSFLKTTLHKESVQTPRKRCSQEVLLLARQPLADPGLKRLQIAVVVENSVGIRGR